MLRGGRPTGENAPVAERVSIGTHPWGRMLPLQVTLFSPRLGRWFQWAPTLGGECYEMEDGSVIVLELEKFQWAPTLGGECYAKVQKANRRL